MSTSWDPLIQSLISFVVVNQANALLMSQSALDNALGAPSEHNDVAESS